MSLPEVSKKRDAVENKQIQSESSNALVSTSFVPSKDVADNLDVLETILQGTEWQVFVALHLAKSPLTTREVRSRIIEEFFDLGFNEFKTDKKWEPLVIEYRKKMLSANRTQLVAWKHDQIRKWVKTVPSLEMKVPSYELVEKSLHSLERMGIATTRPYQMKQAEKIWLLNPLFSKLWQNRRMEIVKILQKADKAEMIELFPRNVLKFYEIDLDALVEGKYPSKSLHQVIMERKEETS